MGKVMCDCRVCFKRVRFLKRKGTPARHEVEVDVEVCRGSYMPPTWVSDKSIDIGQLVEEYKKKVGTDGD